MTDLPYLSATGALRMFGSGELSPVELAEAVIERAEAAEPVVNAFAETFYARALEAARAAEARYAGRGVRGPAPRPLEGLLVEGLGERVDGGLDRFGPLDHRAGQLDR